MAKRKLLLLGVLVSLAGPRTLHRKRRQRLPASRPTKNKSLLPILRSSKLATPRPRSIRRPSTPSNSTSYVTFLRPMPAHWTYMGENYVLIGDADGKIYKAYNGDIFYHR